MHLSESRNHPKHINISKSTICNMLQNPFHIPELACLFAGTRNITFNRITTTHRHNAYVFNIIDSPGYMIVCETKVNI